MRDKLQIILSATAAVALLALGSLVVFSFHQIAELRALQTAKTQELERALFGQKTTAELWKITLENAVGEIVELRQAVAAQAKQLTDQQASVAQLKTQNLIAKEQFAALTTECGLRLKDMVSKAQREVASYALESDQDRTAAVTEAVENLILGIQQNDQRLQTVETWLQENTRGRNRFALAD